jgi:hypothetical protein
MLLVHVFSVLLTKNASCALGRTLRQTKLSAVGLVQETVSAEAWPVSQLSNVQEVAWPLLPGASQCAASTVLRAACKFSHSLSKVHTP